MWNKKNQKKLNPQEKRAEEERKQELERVQSKFESIFDLIKTESKSIQDALVFVEAMVQTLERRFESMRSKTRVYELEIDKGIKNVPEGRRYSLLLESLGTESVASAGMILGMARDKIGQVAQQKMSEAVFSNIIIPK